MVTAAERAVDRAGGCLEGMRSGCFLLIFNAFMLGFVALLFYFFNASWNLEQNGVETTGVVIGLAESYDEGSTYYAPVVEYTVGGERYTFESGAKSSPADYAVNEEVPIRYDPNNPSDGEVISFWTSPALFGGVLALLIIVTLVADVYMVWQVVRGRALVDE